jgi:DNA-binding MarR family transcriptional regulator
MIALEDPARTERLNALAGTLRTLIWLGQRRGQTALAALGLTVAQAVVLDALAAAGGRRTMHDLARLTRESGPTLTGIVDRLLEAGLLARTRGPTDRRVIEITLTEAGRARYAAFHAIQPEHLARITGAFSDAELAEFDLLLRKFVQRLEETG